MEHTKLPWKFNLKTGGAAPDCAEIISDNDVIAMMNPAGCDCFQENPTEQDKANAQFIVQCVNEREKLLDLIYKAKGLILVLARSDKDFKLSDPWMKQFKEAISRATEGK